MDVSEMDTYQQNSFTGYLSVDGKGVYFAAGGIGPGGVVADFLLGDEYGVVADGKKKAALLHFERLSDIGTWRISQRDPDVPKLKGMFVGKRGNNYLKLYSKQENGEPFIFSSDAETVKLSLADFVEDVTAELEISIYNVGYLAWRDSSGYLGMSGSRIGYRCTLTIKERYVKK